ncbi:hypothetical protein DFH07DRAFT_838318 [Mycena maculata]|uniref:Uncharacterized protein n=1 Tax=Mycena maculata TaxID=230809 RepID=A0AAD7IG59_9AGAR|nr:hypothetical protein DFH07DRAFT_838318 [Mycena maculata]
MVPRALRITPPVEYGFEMDFLVFLALLVFEGMPSADMVGIVKGHEAVAGSQFFRSLWVWFDRKVEAMCSVWAWRGRG